MKIGTRPSPREDFSSVNVGEVFTVDGSTSTYLKTEPLLHGETRNNVNCISLVSGVGKWFGPAQRVKLWSEAMLTFK